ncbi:hypothetical protein BpHYR1_048784 [Brachionus plicatilis]|uniref:Uncharacterized protein n=1 Tax=Brachionus plicatilis TaxID=10195 RepID=A0A3M7QYU8_BRAPC|nr:hypothetical protein BpHYR1_048784 [Brachionus plicatilis]
MPGRPSCSAMSARVFGLVGQNVRHSHKILMDGNIRLYQGISMELNFKTKMDWYLDNISAGIAESNLLS